MTAANNAVLDHPGSQQPVAWRPAVPAVVRLLVDLWVDAAREPDAWRVFHARHLFCCGRAAILRRIEYLGDRARRRTDRRSHWWPVRTAGAGTAENQSARAGVGDARNVLYHFGCVSDAMGWGFHSRTYTAKPAGADASIWVRVSNVPSGAGRMRGRSCDRSLRPHGTNPARRDDPRWR